MDKKIDGLALSTNKRFDGVNETIDRLAISTQNGFDRVDKRFEKIEGEIGKLSSNQAQMMGDIRDMKEEKEVRDYQIGKERKWREITTNAMKNKEVLDKKDLKKIQGLGVLPSPGF